MLRFLRVANLAVVREVEIELAAGLTVITGETGAGKSILIDALSLLLGGRASGDLLRTGAESASVEGIFRVEGNPPLLGLLAELGIEAEDGELVLRRELLASGKGRAYVNGALCPRSALKRLGGSLCDVYGQHEHVRLLDPSAQVDLLDHFAGLLAAREEVSGTYRRLKALEDTLAELHAQAAERARRADFLRFELKEIEEARPRAGEEEELLRERSVLTHRARLVELATGGFQALYEADDAVLGRIAAVGKAIAELGEIDPRLAPLAPQVEAARAALEDVSLSLRDYAEKVPHDASRLDQVERRLQVLERLCAKYGPTAAGVLAFAGKAAGELQTLVVSDEERRRMEGERDQERGRYRSQAEALSRARRQAARRLSARVEEELKDLAMEQTRFRVAITSEPDASWAPGWGAERTGFGPSGIDRVEFHVSANLGEEPRPLARVASGGELSRLLLALRTVAADHEPSRIAVFHGLEAGLAGKVAVFDEVDAGIGGKVAYVLARKLGRLAKGRQVLCVTHLAPIAAAAGTHLRAKKEEKKGRTEVAVSVLDGRGRAEELGRMLAGDDVTEAVRRHADELLAAFSGRGRC